MIIDVRERPVFQKKPSKYMNIPEHQIKYQIDFLIGFEELEFICSYGTHSRKAAHKLEKFGVKCKSRILNELDYV
jgi:rhodanese-related sulfurtransferase